jgi:hypothetical protein
MDILDQEGEYELLLPTRAQLIHPSFESTTVRLPMSLPPFSVHTHSQSNPLRPRMHLPLHRLLPHHTRTRPHLPVTHTTGTPSMPKMTLTLNLDSLTPYPEWRMNHM